MKILVLGGSIFIGRHIVEAALSRGHEVSIFNRGRSDPLKLNNVDYLYGDRNKDLSALHNKEWDFVMDVSGYTPSAVQSSVNLLKNSVKNYVFISSGSVYKDLSVSYLDENSPLQRLNDQEIKTAERLANDDSPTALTYGKYYGGLKAKCEEILFSSIPNKALVIRAGIVVGPYDYTNRFLYWLRKLMAGGECVLPENISVPLSLIDARDLANFVIALGERGETGIYNATGMQNGLTFENFLKCCQKISNQTTQFVTLSEDFINEQEIKYWEELPLLVPKAVQGIYCIDDKKAVAKGLEFRTLATSLAETLEWILHSNPNFKIKVGIERAREIYLISVWRKLGDA